MIELETQNRNASRSLVVKVLSHGAIFLATNQRKSSLGRRKMGKYMFPSQFANIHIKHSSLIYIF